jgi:hypothetical protein
VPRRAPSTASTATAPAAATASGHSPAAATSAAPSDDERWLVVDGRRWRRTDPGIPPTLAKELVDELMDARRAVKVGKAADDHDAVRAARARVDAAKHALGERGRAWWLEADDAARRTRASATIRALAEHRAPRSICPSDAARVIGGEQWRQVMPLVREVAAELARDGRVQVTQKGAPVDLDGWTGPVRITLVPRDTGR